MRGLNGTREVYKGNERNVAYVVVDVVFAALLPCFLSIEIITKTIKIRGESTIERTNPANVSTTVNIITTTSIRAINSRRCRYF